MMSSIDEKSVASKTMPMYRITWKSKLTNTNGHGAETFPHEQAKSIARTLNGEGDNLIHWAELAQIDAKIVGED